MDKTIVDQRKARLKSWIEADFQGNVAAFCRYYNQNKSMASYISQLFSGGRNFGEKAARKLESDTGRPEGWLDWPDGEAKKVEVFLKTPSFRYDHDAVAALPQRALEEITRFIAFTVEQHKAKK